MSVSPDVRRPQLIPELNVGLFLYPKLGRLRVGGVWSSVERDLLCDVIQSVSGLSGQTENLN